MNKIQLTIDVTAEDIAEGVMNSAHNCPIALATNRASREKPGGQHSKACVSYDRIDVCNIGLYDYRSTPSSRAQNFIARFDTGKEVHPFKFRTTLKSL